MRKRLRSVFKIVSIVLVLLTAGLIVFANVMMNGFDDSSAISKLNDAGINYKQQFVQHGSYRINTYQIGDPSLPKALLIHGSPGNWSDWINVILDKELLSKMCLIVMDRPGYGYTEMPPTKELAEQANVANSIMTYYCDDYECYTVAGHSYGGGVVEQILIDHPTTTAKGVYVAGTLSPEHQPRKWYNYLASLYLINWMVPKMMQSSNIEMMNLQSDLNKNDALIGNIRQPIILIQGTKDDLVPFETVDYYKKMKSEGVTYVIIEGMNHFIPWSNPELIVDALLQN